MATASDHSPHMTAEMRFFRMMAWVMSIIIVTGFSVNLAMGRSSFDVPIAYHIHAGIFMGWIALYLAQHMSIAAGNRALHISLGRLAYVWIPAMVIAGSALLIVVARSNGGPFFFNASEFLISNITLLWTFGGLAWWALHARRHTGWHRRLMLCSMAMLTGPGLGRLIPMPLLIPYAWTAVIALTWIFPLIGMVHDKRRNGQVHPAYWWGLGIYVAVFIVSMLRAYSPAGYAITDWVIAGTPGAERPMAPFLPPGFSM